MEIDEEGTPRWEPDLEAVAGANIRRLREARGLSQRQMCVELVLHGLSWHQTTLSKVEAGDKPLRVNEAAALASYFDVPVESLWDATEMVELQAAQDEVQASIARERELRRAEEQAQQRLQLARMDQAIAERKVAAAREKLKAEMLRQKAAKAKYETLLRERDRRAGGRRGQHREEA